MIRRKRRARRGESPQASGRSDAFEAFATQTIELFTRIMIRAGCSSSTIEKAVKNSGRLFAQTVRSTAKRSRVELNDPGHILTLWSQDPDYLSADGALRPVPARGVAPSIEALVERVTPPLTFAEAWEQLERTRTLQQVGELYVPREEAIIYLRDPELLAANTLRFLNVCLQNLEHNVERGSSEPWYLRSAQHADFPLDCVSEYLDASIKRGMEFLKAEDVVMLRVANDRAEVSQRRRVSVNLFYSVVDAGTSDTRGATAEIRKRRITLGKRKTTA